MKSFSLMIFLSLFLLALFSPVLGMAQPGGNDVLMIPVNKPLPVHSRKIAEIKIGNNSTQVHCDYEQLVLQAKEKAKQKGGNVVKITRLITPSFISTCYRIQADVLYTDSLESYKAQYVPRDTEMLAVHVNVDSGAFASLYVYRLQDTLLFSPNYDLYLGKDSVISKVRNKTRDIVKLYNEGKTEIHTYNQSVFIDLRFGAKYYLRCGSKMGEIKQMPFIELVSNDIGEKEFNSLSSAKKELSIGYFSYYH